MNQKVDVFITEDTLKFKSSKKNQQEVSLAFGARQGIPKANASSYYPNTRVEAPSGEPQTEQAKK